MTYASRHAVALVALVLALGGTATAATLINGEDIKKGTVTSKQVKDGSLTRKDFAKGQLPAGAGGTAGSNGAKGETGATGAPGTAGDRGATGPTGPSGQNGARGVDGAAGAAGANGTGLMVETTAGAPLGTLVDAMPGVASSFDPQTNVFTPAKVPTLTYMNGAGRLITVTTNGDFKPPVERVLYYENYNSGLCSGRVFAELQPLALPNQLFRVGSGNPQAYFYDGDTTIAATNGVYDGQSCQQLGNPAGARYEVEQAQTPAALNSPLRIATP